MDKQPTALRIADLLEFSKHYSLVHIAAAELRRLHQVNQELVEALKEIAEWTERYTSAGHPISTVARAALAKHRGQA